jgi:hypothetical protein
MSDLGRVATALTSKSTCVSGLPVHHGLVLRPNHVLENVGGKSEMFK